MEVDLFHWINDKLKLNNYEKKPINLTTINTICNSIILQMV